MKLVFWRPNPQFHRGSIVLLKEGVLTDSNRSLLIFHTRWVKPNGKNKKQWVHDCLLLQMENGKISVRTGITCVSESNIQETLVSSVG